MIPRSLLGDVVLIVCVMALAGGVAAAVMWVFG